MRRALVLCFGVSFVVACSQNSAKELVPAPGPGPVYQSPEVAVEHLAKAVENGDGIQIRQVLGVPNVTPANPESNEVRAMANFSALLKQDYDLEEEKDNVVRLNVGEPKRRFPIPLRAVDGGWQFDLQAGREELEKATMRRNETRAIVAGREIIDAQKKYAEVDRDGDGILEFADRLVSSEGKLDGLYWVNRDPTTPSLLAFSLAQAGVDVRNANGIVAVPANGYFFKLLGADEEGSFADEQGNLQRGVALLAYPAKYNVSGQRSYVFLTSGRVYQKDLGAETEKFAAAFNTFLADESWEKLTQLP